MTKLNVVNKKNEVAGVAIEMENGRFEITEAGVAKEVAASTFKRWYKVTGEVTELNLLEELLKDAEVVEDVVHLTEMEKMVLNAMRNNEYNDALEGAVFSFTVIDNSGMEPAQARGVISSLVKKDLIQVIDNYIEENTCIYLTEEGEALFQNSTGKDCSWGGPKLLAVAEVVEEDLIVEEPKNQADVQSIRILETRGGKCEKIVLTVLFNELSFVITEYDGYVCDVTLEDAKGNVVYKSTKMSIKDALEHLGYTGDDLKAARKVIMSLRKEAKQAI